MQDVQSREALGMSKGDIRELYLVLSAQYFHKPKSAKKKKSAY